MDYSFASTGVQTMHMFQTRKQVTETMIQIISKFEELHKKTIVHGGIDIMNLKIKGENLDDIRIDYFFYSFKDRTKILNKNPCYVSPEQIKDNLLTYEGDVYNLAIALASMEKPIWDYLHDVCNRKYDANSITDQDIDLFRNKIISYFKNNTKVKHLAEVIEKAINKKPSNRYKSMTDFKTAIIKVHSKLPNETSPFNFNIKIYQDLYDATNNEQDLSSDVSSSSYSQHQSLKQFVKVYLTQLTTSESKMII